MDGDCRKIFDGLVANAMSFLKKSIEEFDNDIKYSIIHFCIALESLLKAELLHEHWSLIFRKPENASWTNFLAGDFQSVSSDEAISRLQNIARKGIDKTAQKYFGDIVKERNRIIHFCNEDIPKERIAASQLNAWYHIDKLLRKWHQHFRRFAEDKNEFRVSMGKQREYLRIKYNKIKKKLQNLNQARLFLMECPHCNYKSLVIPVKPYGIVEPKCRVCEHVARGIVIRCPDCGQLDFVCDTSMSQCACKKERSPRELVKIIESGLAYRADIQHGEEIDWIANCTACDENSSVIRLNGDVWFCANCFETFEKVSVCEWCNERYTGELEDTYAFGCNACDGYEGWHKDD